ncbi:MAG: hypothetical protein K8E24_005240 [Methanobacterium paludis]|nr:hypothetical protein [Methanobacterium paludis]
MKNNENEIMIKEIVNSNLGMRSSAKEFFKGLNQSHEKEILINFENVKFMSRSFAQEYVQQKKRTDKVIKEKNIPENVVRMLDVVRKSSKPKNIVLASL